VSPEATWRLGARENLHLDEDDGDELPRFQLAQCPQFFVQAGPAFFEDEGLQALMSPGPVPSGFPDECSNSDLEGTGGDNATNGSICDEGSARGDATGAAVHTVISSPTTSSPKTWVTRDDGTLLEMEAKPEIYVRDADVRAAEAVVDKERDQAAALSSAAMSGQAEIAAVRQRLLEDDIEIRVPPDCNHTLRGPLVLRRQAWLDGRSSVSKFPGPAAELDMCDIVQAVCEGGNALSVVNENLVMTHNLGIYDTKVVDVADNGRPMPRLNERREDEHPEWTTHMRSDVDEDGALTGILAGRQDDALLPDTLVVGMSSSSSSSQPFREGWHNAADEQACFASETPLEIRRRLEATTIPTRSEGDKDDAHWVCV